jgi:hypothetical protein
MSRCGRARAAANKPSHKASCADRRGFGRLHAAHRDRFSPPTRSPRGCCSSIVVDLVEEGLDIGIHRQSCRSQCVACESARSLCGASPATSSGAGRRQIREILRRMSASASATSPVPSAGALPDGSRSA